MVLTGECRTIATTDSDAASIEAESTRHPTIDSRSALPISEHSNEGNIAPLPAKGMTVEECSTTMHPECVMTAAPAAPATPAPGTPAVTLRDIASFRPAEPSDVMEPEGWAIQGLPANFVANSNPEIVAGTLLGQPADVRFTPLGYRWVHSDGGTVASASPGATWTALGVAEFTPTGTSHVYAASGEFTVTLQVSLGAEYRFAGSGWLPIAGRLTIDAAPQRVLVGEVDTVLTVGDCTAYPSSPGC